MESDKGKRGGEREGKRKRDEVGEREKGERNGGKGEIKKKEKEREL